MYFVCYWEEGTHMEKSEENFESVPIFHHVGSGDQPQVTRLGRRCWPGSAVLEFEDTHLVYCHQRL